MGIMLRFISWLDQQLVKIKPSPLISHRQERLNTFDCDGVVFINEEVGGVYPGRADIIITGRSFEEAPETKEMLHARGIYNRVFFNRTKFDNKTRVGSGLHKAETIKRLQKLGYTVMCHFEDDEVQADVIRKNCPNVTVVMLVHELTNKENVRHLRTTQ